jgi:hypothetical protein
MTKINSLIALLITIALISCNNIIIIKDYENQYKTVLPTKSKGRSLQNEIPYSIADHYFVKNTFKAQHFSDSKIETQANFDEIFGSAPITEPDGNPTTIDFTKQFVIAITEPETDVETMLIPKSLSNVGKTITFKYEIKRGFKTSFTTKPFLIIVVDNKYRGKVKVTRYIEKQTNK